MTLAFKLFVILLMSSIWCELSGIRKALEKIEKDGTIHKDSIGKTVFFTREEAEQALQKRGVQE